MNLKDLLLKKKEGIVNKWFGLIIDSYPPDTTHFLRNQKNQFTNPVGHTIRTAIEGIFDELLSPSDSVRVNTYLDNIIRIRAIQGFTPSVALNFLFLLKDVVRQEIMEVLHEDGLFAESPRFIGEELLNFESRVDRLLMESFDIYMGCRERIFELSAIEARNMTYRLLEGANLIKNSSETLRPDGEEFDST